MSGSLEIVSASTTECADCLHLFDDWTEDTYYTDRRVVVQLTGSDFAHVVLLREPGGDNAISIGLKGDARDRIRSSFPSGTGALLVIAGADMPVAVFTDTDPRRETLLEGLVDIEASDASFLEAFEQRLTWTREIQLPPRIDSKAGCEAAYSNDTRSLELCLVTQRARSEERFFKDLDARRRRGEITGEEADRLVDQFEMSE